MGNKRNTYINSLAKIKLNIMKTTILLMTLLNFGTFYSQSAVSFNVTESSKFNISNLNYQGEIIHSKFWQDRNGENIVLFTRKEVREKY